VDNSAQLLAPLSVGYTRFDSGVTAAQGNTLGSVGSANAQYGIWCSHIVIAGTLNNATLFNGVISWIGSASIKDGVTGATDQRISSMAVPAPGALALLGVAGFASRRRRA
jgi:MYXO-CTERM domain-containing protein